MSLFRTIVSRPPAKAPVRGLAVSITSTAASRTTVGSASKTAGVMSCTMAVGAASTRYDERRRAATSAEAKDTKRGMTDNWSCLCDVDD